MPASDEIEFRIPRSGNTTLTGRGRLIASINRDDISNTKRKDRFHRWHNLALYETRAGKFVLHIAYRTNFIDKENDHDRAHVFATLPEALFFAREVYNPVEFYVGHPPGHPNAAKGETVKAQFIERYRADCLELTAQATTALRERETEVQ